MLDFQDEIIKDSEKLQPNKNHDKTDKTEKQQKTDKVNIEIIKGKVSPYYNKGNKSQVNKRKFIIPVVPDSADIITRRFETLLNKEYEKRDSINGSYPN